MLATALAQSYKVAYGPDVQVDMLVRGEVADLIRHCPAVGQVHVFDKKESRIRQIITLSAQFGLARYDAVINLQRYLTTGLVMALSGTPIKVGFAQNPVSFLFSHRLKHNFREGYHETQRNLALAQLAFPKLEWQRPLLVPDETDVALIANLRSEKPSICLAPASVWATKRVPDSFWIEAAMQAPDAYEIFWLGGKSDRIEIEQLAQKAGRGRVVAGDLTLMQSAELMRQSRITLANDSGPVHLASAVDAPICAVYCSTAPVFGFYPISTQSFIVEEKVGLHCRPCGIHGYNKCPRGHFLCGKLLNEQIASVYAEAFSKPLVSDSVTNAS